MHACAGVSKDRLRVARHIGEHGETDSHVVEELAGKDRSKERVGRQADQTRVRAVKGREQLALRHRTEVANMIPESCSLAHQVALTAVAGEYPDDARVLAVADLRGTQGFAKAVVGMHGARVQNRERVFEAEVAPQAAGHQLVHGGAAGDTQTIAQTEAAAKAVLDEVIEDEAAKTMAEVVADKGYHSNDVLTAHRREGTRTYISEPNRGRRRWIGKPEEKAATYANRRRIRGSRGKGLLRARGEKIERTFAHCYETGGMRRLHLRGDDNARKRLLIHDAGYNLSLLMRKLYSVGTPRALQGLSGLVWALLRLWKALQKAWRRLIAAESALDRFLPGWRRIAEAGWISEPAR